MKKTELKYFVILLLSLIIKLGCTSPPVEDPSYSIIEDPGIISDDCCSAHYTTSISGNTPVGGRYYWSALLHKDTLVNYGNPIYLEEGEFSNIDIEIVVSYLDNIPYGEYKKYIYSSANEEDVGKVDLRDIASSQEFVVVADYTTVTCADCCTKNPNISRYKTWAIKDIGNAIGASATIKTRYGKLCGVGFPVADTIKAQSNVFVTIQASINPKDITTNFIQMGYMHLREFSSVDTFVYVEFLGLVNGNEYVIYKIKGSSFPSIGTPIPDSNYTYKVKFNPSSGSIFCYLDNNPVISQETSWWIGKTMRYATWQGEIDGRETDMAGTINNKCEIIDCSYIKDDYVIYNASFDMNDNIGVTPQTGNRPAEWGISYEFSNLKIWDVFPL